MAACLAGSAAGADTYTVFGAKGSLAVSRVIAGSPDKVVTQTLKTNDLINLTLGRPLGTPIDSKVEKLALAVVVEGPGVVATPKTKLIVFNPDPAVIGAAKVVADVASLANLDFQIAVGTKSTSGQGTGSVNIPETTTGVDPANNKFFAATLAGAALAKSSPAVAGVLTSFAATVTGISGPLHFRFTTTKSTTPVDFDGIATKGAFTTTGKPLAVLSL